MYSYLHKVQEHVSERLLGLVRFRCYLKSPKAVHIVKDDHVVTVYGLQYQQLRIMNQSHHTSHQMV